MNDTSGIWESNVFSSPDDTAKFILPLNESSIKLFYNKRIVVDTKVDVAAHEIPRVFEITKVDRLDQRGLCMYTIKQDQWNDETDYVNYTVAGDPSSIQGMYADYYSSTPIVEPEDNNGIVAKIECSGTDELKVGGGYKKLSVTFWDGDTQVDFQDGVWSYEFVTAPWDDALVDVRTKEQNPQLADNQIQIKFLGGGTYVGDTLVVKYHSSDDIVGTIKLLISRL